MLSRIQLILLIVGMFLQSACSRPSQMASDSSIKGHYEASAPHIFSESSGGQRATAEYEESRGVIVSLPVVLRFNKIAMLQAIADTDIDKIWIVVPSTFSESLETGESFIELREALGAHMKKLELIRHTSEGNVSVWARDWAPQGALDENNELTLLDFNYYSNRPADDEMPQVMARQLDYPRISVPVYSEGGNFMNNRLGHCLMTTRVVEANAKAESRDDIIQDTFALTEIFRKAAACKSLKIFPRMPYEGTGHIDMWAKFLDDETIIVGSIPDRIMDLYEFNTDRTKAKSIQSYLDERALEMEDMGYRVKRIPMPMPIFRKRATFRSYTDAQIVNDSVFVPRYRFPADPTIATVNNEYFDKGYLAGYEREVEDLYKSYSYKVTWVDSDDLIYTGGAVHCAVMQIPR